MIRRPVGALGGGLADADASSTSTQSLSPSPLLIGVVNVVVPAFESGESEIERYVPFDGSNQRAVAGPLSFVMSTVSVVLAGAYARTTDASGVRAVVTELLV